MVGSNHFYSASYRFYLGFIFLFLLHQQAVLHRPFQIRGQLPTEQHLPRFSGIPIPLQPQNWGQAAFKNTVRNQARCRCSRMNFGHRFMWEIIWDNRENLSWRCFQGGLRVSILHERQQERVGGRLWGHPCPPWGEEGGQMELLETAAEIRSCRKLIFQ